MHDSEHILISLEPRHAKNILDGVKRVELRRRTMRVNPGATVWLYAKQPVGSVVGHAVVAKTHAAIPATLWRRFSSVAGISREEFFRYFEGVGRGVALELTGATRLSTAIPLLDLHRPRARFHPPQFFARLSPDHPVRSAANGG